MKKIPGKINKLRHKVNKYWLTFIIFVVGTFFIGDSTIMDRMAYNKQIKLLEKEIEYYTKEKEKNEAKLKAIQNEDDGLERFAREQYLMSKPDEEIFIITE
jgi:cell division protein FtsB